VVLVSVMGPIDDARRLIRVKRSVGAISVLVGRSLRRSLPAEFFLIFFF